MQPTSACATTRVGMLVHSFLQSSCCRYRSSSGISRLNDMSRIRVDFGVEFERLNVDVLIVSLEGLSSTFFFSFVNFSLTAIVLFYL